MDQLVNTYPHISSLRKYMQTEAAKPKATPVIIFQQAVKFIEQFGWNKYELFNEKGACLEGSIIYSGTDKLEFTFDRLYHSDGKRFISIVNNGGSKFQSQGRLRRVYEFIRYTLRHNYHSSMTISHFNDRHLIDQQAAIDFLRSCEKNAMLYEDGVLSRFDLRKPAKLSVNSTNSRTCEC